MINSEILLLSNGRIALLILSAIWVVLSIVVISTTFFPSNKSKNEENNKKTTDKSNSKSENKDDLSEASEENKTDSIREHQEVEMQEIVDDAEIKLDALLHGLNLPFNLHLQKEISGDIKKHRIYSTNTDTDTLEVGAAFADELEKIGYQIQPLNYNEAKATRDGSTIKMAIESSKKSELEDKEARFPELEEAIIVEVWMEED